MQASMHEAQAILLRGYRFSESSLVAIWLTDRHGKVKTAARNAFKPGSPFAGRLELFTEAEIVFKPPPKSKSDDLYALGEVTVSSDTALPANYLTLLTASYFAELCDLCTEPMHPAPELFALLQRAWGFLRREHSSRRAVEHFETQLARSLGIYDPAFPAHHSLAATVRRLPANRTRLLKHLESMAAIKP